MSLDSHALRETLGLFVTGVTIITTRGTDQERIGITANSFNSVSLDPPLVLWSVGKSSRSLPHFEAATHYAVHILRDDQAELSKRFAKSGPDKFNGLNTEPGLGDAPLLPDCAARLECSLYGQHPAGDHTIFVARIDRMQSDASARPLVYHGGRYAELADY
ncbi:MAG: flavin reductase family protein [Henriciella sp.]|nr:flavin reductase family protein [Henriciella sp.]